MVDEKDLPEEAAALLEKAAQLLEDHGWLQGHYGLFGRHCSLGAIGAVAQIEYGESYPLFSAETAHFNVKVKALMALSRYVVDSGAISPLDAQYTGGSIQGAGLVVAQWNDARDQTAEDVIATMRKAAVAVREQAA